MIPVYGRKPRNYSNNMLLSIIIPTLNEEDNIGRLLKAVKADKFKDYEIIVADAGSKDKTAEIARNFGCKVIPGGLPAKGRNEGAKAAQGGILLFLDADIILSDNFLFNSTHEFLRRRLDIASYKIYPQISNLIMNRATLNIFYNYPAKALKKVFPMGAMGIMVKKRCFEEVGGFDEKIRLAEDVYFVSQVAKIGSFGIFKSGEIYMPLRRFEQDGYVRTVLKYLKTGVNMKLRGPDRHNKTEYKFGHYKEKKAAKHKI